MNSVSPRLRRFTNAPHNPFRLGTTPALLGSFARTPHAFTTACELARLCSSDRAVVDVLCSYLFGTHGGYFQLHGVATTYREVGEILGWKLAKVWRTFDRLLTRCVVVRVEEPSQWRGPRAYRYHLAHPCAWRTRAAPDGIDTDATLPPSPSTWQTRSGEPVPVVSSAGNKGRTVLPVPVQIPAAAAVAELEDEGWIGPVDNLMTHVSESANTRGGVPSPIEEKPPSKAFEGQHTVDGYWIRRWTGKGECDKAGLVSEVYRYLQRNHPGWTLVCTTFGAVPSTLVADVVDRLNTIDVDHRASWQAGTVRQAMVRARETAEVLEADLEERRRRSELQRLEAQQRYAAEVIATAGELLDRCRAVFVGAATAPGTLAGRELSQLEDLAAELELARGKLVGGNLAELALAIALCEAANDEYGLDILEHELTREARRAADEEQRRQVDDDRAELAAELRVLGLAVQMAKEEAQAVQRPDVPRRGAIPSDVRAHALRPWRQALDRIDRFGELQRQVDRAYRWAAHPEAQIDGDAYNFAELTVRRARESLQTVQRYDLARRNGPDREGSDKGENENEGCNVIMLPVSGTPPPTSQNPGHGVVVPPGGVADVAPECGGGLPSAHPGDVPLRGAVLGTDRGEPGAQRMPGVHSGVEPHPGHGTLDDHPDRVAALDERTAELAPPIDLAEHRTRRDRGSGEVDVEGVQRARLETLTGEDGDGLQLAGLSPSDDKVETYRVLLHVLELQRRKLRAAECRADPEQQHSAVPLSGESGAAAVEDARQITARYRPDAAGPGLLAVDNATEDGGDLR